MTAPIFFHAELMPQFNRYKVEVRAQNGHSYIEIMTRDQFFTWVDNLEKSMKIGGETVIFQGDRKEVFAYFRAIANVHRAALGMI
jgi:hypothetical protein